MKNKQQTLPSKEKKRYQYSAEYFSRGAASHLKNKFNNDGYNQFKKNFDKFKKFKEKKDERIKQFKKLSFENKFKIAKFIGLSAAVVGTGWFLINKINQTYHNFDEKIKKGFEYTNDVYDTYIRDNEKVTSFITGLKSKIKGSFVEPFINGIQAIFGDKSHLLENEYLKEKGIFGTLIPDFGLMSIWYVFSKHGYAWILKLLDVRVPNYFTLAYGMYKHYSENPQGFMYLGRTLKGMESAKIVTESYRGTSEMLGQLNEMWMKYVSSYEGSKNNLLKFHNRMVELYEVLESSHMDGDIRRVTSDSFKYVKLSFVEGKHTAGSDKVIKLGPVELFPVPEYDVAKVKKPFGHTKTYSIISSSTGRRLYYASPDDEKNFGFVKKGIEYIEKQLKELKIHEPDQYEIYKKQWEKITDPNTNERTDFKWTYERLGMLVQFLPLLVQWEIMQSIQSINTARGMYNDILTTSMGNDIILGLEKVLKEKNAESEKFFQDYATGKISVEEMISQMTESLKKTLSDGIFYDFNDVFTLEIDKLQKKIPYMQITRQITDLVTKLKDIRIQKTYNKNNVITINQNTLRVNFQTENIKGIRRDILEGELFDKEYLDEREDFYSKKADVLGLKPYYFIALWDKSFLRGLPISASKDSFYQWQKVYCGEVPYKYYDYDGGKFSYATTRGKNYVDKNGKYNITDEQGEAYGKLSTNMIGERTLYYWKTTSEELVGTKFKNRYEMQGDDGKFYIVDIWDYFYVGGNHSWVWYKSELISKQTSNSSNAALFKGEYSDNDLEDIYKTPSEITIQNILSNVDLSEKMKKELLEERYQILKELEIVNFANGDKGLIFAQNILNN